MQMKNIYNPCPSCSDYPIHCRGLCVDKMKYINEVDEEVQVVRKQRNKRTFSNEYNKNGIRRLS